MAIIIVAHSPSFARAPIARPRALATCAFEGAMHSAAQGGSRIRLLEHGRNPSQRRSSTRPRSTRLSHSPWSDPETPIRGVIAFSLQSACIARPLLVYIGVANNRDAYPRPERCWSTGKPMVANFGALRRRDCHPSRVLHARQGRAANGPGDDLHRASQLNQSPSVTPGSVRMYALVRPAISLADVRRAVLPARVRIRSGKWKNRDPGNDRGEPIEPEPRTWPSA